MPPKVSVIIPTHNPNAIRLERVLFHLKAQTLPRSDWELIVIDNASEDAHFRENFDFSWHPTFQILREPKLGLTHARLAGYQSASAPILVFVDDDNLLGEAYLQSALEAMGQYPNLGAIGGKSSPNFESEPPRWVREFDTCLALRDLGDEIITSPASLHIDAYPEYAPIGAGMVLRKQAMEAFVSVFDETYDPILDRRGSSLSSGGDNDIILHLLKGGWGVGYFPELTLEHIIPVSRISKNYLARLNYETSRSWIKVLHKHGVLPWKAIPASTVWLRKVKAFWQYRAFLDAPRYIRWCGACGMYEALSEL